MLEEQENDFLEGLYKSTYKKLYLFAFSRLKDHARAEELVQDTFLCAKENMSRVIASQNPEGWLYNTLRNKLRHEFRARQIVIKYLEKEYGSGTGFTVENEADDRSFILSLSPDEFELLKLTYLDGFSSAELAAKLGITPAACRKRLHRARKKLSEIQNK